MLIDFKTLVYDMLYKNFKIAHLDTKIKFDVSDTEGVGNKFREAVKKEYNAKFLDDSDYVIGFKEPLQDETKEEEPEDEEESENTEEDSEEADDGDENSEDGDSEEDVKESEIKNLTTKMLKTEAETKATGDDLKAKIRKSIAYTFGIEDNGKVDIYDLPDFLEGFNVFFTKLSLKTKRD